VFGIEADYMLSGLIVFVYHVFAILGAFLFFVYWLFYHPSDLQNASVPLFTVLALIMAIWVWLVPHPSQALQ
jgi:hypothetical protein